MQAILSDVCVYEHWATREFAGLFVTGCFGWVSVLTWARTSPLRHAAICLCKALFLCVSSHVCMWMAWSAGHMRTTDATAWIVDLCGGLFFSFEVCDLTVYQLRQSSRDRGMIFHHLLHIVLGLWVGRHCHARLLPITMLLQESSTVFLNARFLSSPGTVLHDRFSLAFALTFLFYRNILGWLPLYVLTSVAPASLITVDVALCTVAFGLQLYWGTIIAKKVVRTLRRAAEIAPHVD